MYSSDWQDPTNARNLAISQLAEICAQAGLSWSASEKQFIIELPDVVLSRIVPTAPTKKTFDISTWGPVGIDETQEAPDHVGDGSVDALPDDFQTPDTGEILEEGEPPKGDKDAEA